MIKAKTKVFFEQVISHEVFNGGFVTTQVEEVFKDFKILRDTSTTADQNWANSYCQWLEKRGLIPAFKCIFAEDENHSSFLKTVTIGGSH